jgi:hypothetical protein
MDSTHDCLQEEVAGDSTVEEEDFPKQTPLQEVAIDFGTMPPPSQTQTQQVGLHSSTSRGR